MSKIFAHRGFSGKYPENTMIAFKKAVEIGVDGIELDVHLTKDNEIVIIHDEDIKRTCNGEGLVKDMNLSELKKFDASATFKGVYGKNEIPTLREYFELIKSTDVITNIELKTGVFEYPTIDLFDEIAESATKKLSGSDSFMYSLLNTSAEVNTDLSVHILPAFSVDNTSSPKNSFHPSIVPGSATRLSSIPVARKKFP